MAAQRLARYLTADAGAQFVDLSAPIASSAPTVPLWQRTDIVYADHARLSRKGPWVSGADVFARGGEVGAVAAVRRGVR
jgi:hypothetical protein